MGAIEIRLHFQYPIQRGDGVVILPGIDELIGEDNATHGIQRIQLEAAAGLRDSLFVSPHRGQVICVPLSRARRAAVHLNGSAIGTVRPNPIPFEHRSNAGEHGMRFRQLAIEVQSHFRVHLRLGLGFNGGRAAVDTEQV